jgi:hypothetical protein
MITPCPHCGTRVTDYRPVEVMDENDEFGVGWTEEPELDPTAEPAFETVRCIRFVECGHAFEEDSVQAVLDALRELRSLHRESLWTEDADRYRELVDYEIPAQENAVKNRRREVVRREEAEDPEDLNAYE